MNEPRKLRPVTIEGPLRFVPVEEWAERHSRAGHHPQPTQTNENPERWDCECGGLCHVHERSVQPAATVMTSPLGRCGCPVWRFIGNGNGSRG